MTKDNLTRDEARARAALIDVRDYTVELDLTRGDETFGSRTQIRFACREPGASTFVDLSATEVASVRLNGVELPAGAFDGSRIAIGGLGASNVLEVSATCAYQRTGVGMHFFRDPVDGLVYLHTQFEPFDAHRVFACFDQPDLKASFTIAVQVPEDYEVAANTPAESRPAPGAGGMWTFATTPRISSYLTAVVAGPYHIVRDRHGDIDLSIWCRRSLASYLDPEEIFEITKQGLDYFGRAFDYPYPFGTKYDQLFVPEFKFGAMENPGCVTFTERYVFRSKVTDAAREGRAGTILHEMAHMWFGDLVTMRWWDDLWLNESFATFMGTMGMVSATRFKDEWTKFATWTKAAAARQDQLPTTHPIVADVPDLLATHLNFDAITYSKGASVLRQLVAWVGEDAFFEGVRRYFRRHEWGNTDLRDFLRPLEEASGRDLGAWSKEWLEAPGINTVRVEAETSDGRYSSVSVLQEAPEEWPTLRSHRLRVGLYDSTDEGLVCRRSVELDVLGARTTVEDLAGEPAADLVLPNDGDLTYAKIAFDPRSLDTLTHRLGELRDSLGRALCWASVWQMVRDAQMRSRDYLELVLNNIAAEHDIAVVQGLLDRAGIFAVYGDPANRDACYEHLGRAAEAAMRAAAPGSDLQLAWSRAFVGAGRTAEQLAFKRGLLDGTETVDGLVVDTDFRWMLVGSLVRRGAADETLIAAEHERDPTDQGARHAASVRAGRPTPEAKEEAWNLIVSDESQPLAMVRSVVMGFHDGERPDLMEPYAQRYFDAISPVWEQREIEFGLTFVRGMYPATLIDERTLAMTDEYLARPDLPRPVRRVLIEGRDEVARALRARAKDAEPA